MKIKSKGAAPRLQFTEAELKEEALQKSVSRVKKAEVVRVKARKRLHQTMDSIDEHSSHLHHAETSDARSVADKTASVERTQRQHSTEFIKRLNTEPIAKSFVLKSAVPDSIQSRLHSVSELQTPKSRLKSDAAGQAMEKLLAAKVQVEHSNYHAVYTALLPTGWKIRSQCLGKLYDEFNVNHPSDFYGHSLSVSDVIGLKINGKITTHYVDRGGFQKLNNFIPMDNSLKNAEMAMEDDYGMIDGIINNGKSAALQESRERPSVADQLKQPGKPSHRESRFKPDERSL